MDVGSIQSMPKEGRQINLKEVSANERGHKGTVWALEGSEDLNANLVRFPSGEGVDEHVNDEVDVIVVGVDGLGSVTVGGKEHHLSAGDMVFVPKGARRSVGSESAGFTYLSIHRSRGPLRLDTGQKTRGEA